MKAAVLLMLASMGFGATAALLLTKPPVVVYFFAKLLTLIR
jgi:hypothetical protein